MKGIIITAMVFLILFSFSASAEEFKVLELTDNEIYCQIINTDLECQTLNNQIGVVIRSDVDLFETDFELRCGNSIIETFPYKCNKTENVYTCYFDIEPIIRLSGMDSTSCETLFYFYTKSLNETLGNERYDGKLELKPIIENNILSLEKQKSKLSNDYEVVKEFDKESVYNTGICSTLGTNVLFSGLESYENIFTLMGGKLTEASTVSGKSLNLLKDSTVLSSSYLEKTDILLPLMLDNLIQQGILTGSFVNQLIQQITQGYFFASIFYDVKNDVTGSCQKIENNFEELVNPNFIALEKMLLLDCLEKRDFKNCWKKLGEMKQFINPGNSPSVSEMRIYSGGYLLRHGSNVCGNKKITIEYENMGKFNVNKIDISGPGNCENTIIINGDGSESYDVSEFLCGDSGYIVDGGRYEILIDPGARGEKVTYSLNYFEDEENCRIKQELIPV